ncbi:hypothetical protein ATANTOWER_008678 [Ataeniobius toweri]|uniref:Secreted protein n=1 Tax=Ataeniobius toweri TaxID=208326 RepID=A0ABU7AEC0_9TELE|nr:hypothetical protein [Ataeniobius toweri]
MGFLCWMAVSLALLLSAHDSLAVVDQNQLRTLIKQVLNIYKPSYTAKNQYMQHYMKTPMFSLVVSIPFNNKTKQYDISQLPDGTLVKKTILDCYVYIGQRVVAATVLKWPDVLDQCPNGNVLWPDFQRGCPKGVRTWSDVSKQCNVKTRADHAEYRTVQDIGTLLLNHSQNDLLLFYVYASPCAQKCTNISNTANILQKIQRVGHLKNFAFVFSKVFKPRGSESLPVEELRGALTALGSTIGLQNIFRCDDSNDSMNCTNCSSHGEVARECYVDQRSGQQSIG